MKISSLMMHIARGVAAVALLLSLVPAHAVYRCVDAKGGVSYSAGACDKAATGRELKASPGDTSIENFLSRAAGSYVRLPDSKGFYDRLRNWGSVNTDATPSRLELSSSAASFEGNDASKIVCRAPAPARSDQMLMAGEDAAVLDPRIGQAAEDELAFFYLRCQAIEPKQLEKSALGPDNELALPILLARINDQSLMLVIRGRTEYVQIYQRAGAVPASGPSQPASKPEARK
jgi:hypothetical protein